MNMIIRPAGSADADACGHICYEAFKVVNERHGFPSPFASAEAASDRVDSVLRHPSFFGVVAESSDDGRIVGFSFLSERDPIRAVGPVAVDPAVQSRGLGRRLMQAVLERARGARGVRPLQDAFNMQSLSLYASLGFEAKELCVALSGVPVGPPLPGWEVRLLTEADLEACEALHERIHGHPRTNELREALSAGLPVAALRGGRIRAYMAVPTIWLANFGVSETEADMQALLLGAARIAETPLSFLLPIRQATLLRWSLSQSFRTIRPMTLMAIGEYQEPQGSYIPSVLY